MMDEEGRGPGSMSFKGMAPEDIFAMGIKKGLDMVKDMGREGDTELVHVNEEEKEALKDMGGRGSINPASGLREYPPAGADIEGTGRGRGGGLGGGEDRDDAMGRSASSRTAETRGMASGVAQRGDAMGQSASSRTAETRAISGTPSSQGGTVSDMEPNKGQSSPPDERSFGERVIDGMRAAFGGGSFGPPTGTDPGFMGQAVGMVPGIGAMMGFTRGMQAMGFPGSPKNPGEIGTDEYSGQREGDNSILSPGAKPQQQGPLQQPASQYAWNRPSAAPTVPGGLSFDGGMTPLQQRTAVATGGTSGNAGIYRDPAVVEFYRNLALYDLTQPGGAPRADATVTPIERQFVEQLGGQPGQDLSSFLTALAGLKPA